MAEKENSLYEKLKSGETVQCPVCHKGVLKPYNTTPEKAHCFDCSNDECKARYHYDPVINID